MTSTKLPLHRSILKRVLIALVELYTLLPLDFKGEPEGGALRFKSEGSRWRQAFYRGVNQRPLDPTQPRSLVPFDKVGDV